MHAHHYESIAVVHAAPPDLFAFADDHSRLSSHMSKSSWMMGGGSMSIETDGGGGKAVGSKLTLRGAVFGLQLQVEERVTERSPPYRKVWATEGAPKLLVIGPYEMGFEVQPFEKGSRMKVFINYSWPTGVFGVACGFLFARAYARWCTMRMANDAASHFEAINARA